MASKEDQFIKQLLSAIQEMGGGHVFEIEDEEILSALLKENNDQLATALTQRLPSGSIRIERTTTADRTIAAVHLQGVPMPFISDEDGLGVFLIGFAAGLTFMERVEAGDASG